MTTIQVGQTLTLAKGKQVSRVTGAARLTRDTTVTIRRTESARNGKTRVYWKSNGYLASALV